MNPELMPSRIQFSSVHSRGSKSKVASIAMSITLTYDEIAFGTILFTVIKAIAELEKVQKRVANILKEVEHCPMRYGSCLWGFLI